MLCPKKNSDIWLEIQSLNDNDHNNNNNNNNYNSHNNLTQCDYLSIKN